MDKQQLNLKINYLNKLQQVVESQNLTDEYKDIIFDSIVKVCESIDVDLGIRKEYPPGV
ncbi:hypothetical protein [Paenibacillus macquariensis]|uniref:Uncharacterized protein n=1 Tax=Paenibacillus macquariensis TaxID=948756 RepID=A0ABY1JS73_9BACL|nr:hypothetical protein [Paenibacillus macquariensis]MEC0092874.1 hypothetical protein [Paenibacillus macquariensis]SIQ67936.1 hypothetical protein SAMN05421578_103328 [Paenibacillus macquariensis]